MTAIATQPTKWSEMPHINSVIEFSDTDKECLAEIRDILKKHGNLNRFGISLLHNHFEVGEDEFLLETTDEKRRTQYIRPVKKAEFEGHDMVVTSLRLVEGEAIAEMSCRCGRDKDGHDGTHPNIPDDIQY